MAADGQTYLPLMKNESEAPAPGAILGHACSLPTRRHRIDRLFLQAIAVRAKDLLTSQLESLEGCGPLLKECRYALHKIVGSHTRQKHVVFGNELICQLRSL